MAVRGADVTGAAVGAATNYFIGGIDHYRHEMSETPEGLERRPGKSAAEIRDAYDDEEAEQYHDTHWLKLRIAARTRRHQFGGVDGRVLDVACGTGENFRYLPETAEVVGVDISADMLERAREAAADLGRRVELEQMDAQRLSFEDDSFDHVVSALSTCTFPDPIEALNEIGRVCKPTGRVRLLEHHRWDFAPLARLQERRAEEEYRRVGCRLYDDPTAVVERSELAVVEDVRWRLPPFTGVVARPPEA